LKRKFFDDKIVTEVVPLEAFYQAEDYHQDYERHNPNNPYVRSVSIPRLKRFQAKFPHLLKENQAH
ncbi:MAG: peptide-methionine (S)-S-oxide reductase, partial [Saprospiraceae bacterium]|nr:peptide-methionine (S)-S-oxide reductase [Saprospiraceae bacterium]